MAFTDFKSLEQALVAFEIRLEKKSILSENQSAAPSQTLIDDINFALTETAYNASEEAICESIIYPILREVWKPFRNELSLFSHKSINAGNLLVGTPDYLVAKRSPLGNVVLDTPLLITVEAKRDDFENAWGQCLAQMQAITEINTAKGLHIPVYGIVSNGLSWQIAKLYENILTQNTDIYTLTDLKKLYAVIVGLLNNCASSLNN
jgi:hypothetical protein